MPPTLETRRSRVPQLSELPFHSIYRHGFVRVAVATPSVEVASPASNVVEMVRIAREAASSQAILVVFPELGISAYSNEDLFQQDALLDGSIQALATLVEASKDIAITFAVGIPLRVDDRLFNCAVVLRRGQLLGAVPKSYLPNYREFYEKRQFAPAAQALSTSIRLLGQTVPSARRCCSRRTTCRASCSRLEVCEDVWAPLPPSTLAALAGATVIANLSASDVTVGKAELPPPALRLAIGEVRRGLPFSAAGPGESTTDLAWDGHALIYENGAPLRRVAALSAARRLHHGGPRPGPPAPGTDALDDVRRLRAGTQVATRGLPARRDRTRRTDGPRATRRAASSAFRTCRPTLRAATSAAPRCTTSRSRHCASGSQRRD